MKRLIMIPFLLMFIGCFSNLSRPDTSDTGTNNPLEQNWINLVYDQNWKKIDLGFPSDEDFPFQTHGGFVMDFQPSPFSPNSFITQPDTTFNLYSVLDNLKGAYYRITYIIGSENIELYVLIGFGKRDNQMQIYLPKGHVSAPVSSASDDVKSSWLKSKYIIGYTSSLGQTIALKKPSIF